VALVVGLSDINDEPAIVRTTWRAQGADHLLDRIYDRILVYGDREVFDPPHEYGFSPLASAKTVFCGYLARSAPGRPAGDVRVELGAGAEPLVAVTAGGGADGGPLLRAYLAACREGRLTGLTSVAVAGPHLPAAERAELEAVAAGLPDLTLIAFTSDLASYLNAADLIVTMGGYNAVAEALSLGKRTIVVPRVAPWREQLIRAERLADRGLIRLVHPTELSPARLADEARVALASPPPVVDLAFDGLAQVAGALVNALGA
jgi:predicted glycosyltransferase